MTMCTLRRHRAFESPAAVAAARDQLLTVARREGFSILGYVFMPDHLHFVVEGLHRSADLVQFARKFRRAATAAQSPQVRPLWQDGYFERVLRSHDQTVSVLRYMLDNPVRAGLVERWQDYPDGWSVLHPRA
jgi:REP element-mobilizing transposase RayT